MILDVVLKELGINCEPVSIVPLRQGLINDTWRISLEDDAYILQKINDNVFKNPADIAGNISLVAAYLEKKAPGYVFAAPLKTIDGLQMIHKKGYGYFRAFPFIKGSHTIETVETPEQAYEAALQFGNFTHILKDLDVSELKTTIPSFHDLSLRYALFSDAIKNDAAGRVKTAAPLIKELLELSWIVETYAKIKTSPAFRLRVTHHDTKISNVLFDKDDKGICVIDLDTVMPGYFISDVGDMMRTYISPSSEDEKDYSKIEIRSNIYDAILQGYLTGMKDELSKEEKELFFYAGPFMIYMQAIRFLTDYLNGDLYYGTAYPEHNLVRAGNQTVLLQRLLGLKNYLK